MTSSWKVSIPRTVPDSPTFRCVSPDYFSDCTGNSLSASNNLDSISDSDISTVAKEIIKIHTNKIKFLRINIKYLTEIIVVILYLILFIFYSSFEV